MPDDDAQDVGWRTAYPDEIPGGATAVANKARKAGWDVRVGFARGPWIGSDGDDKTTTAEEGAAPVVAICQMISVQGRLGEKKFHANWHCKLWTKPGQEGKYAFAGAMMWPPVKGPMFSTKAKKDRHPESLEDATIGGLKNSATLNAYLKETTS